MRLTNTQRNEFWDRVLAIPDLSACQIKFLIYLYNQTFECNLNNVYIPKLVDLAEAWGYDPANLRKDILELSDNSIINKHRKAYSINLDYQIWYIDTKLYAKIHNYNNYSIYKQLKRGKGGTNASKRPNEDTV